MGCGCSLQWYYFGYWPNGPDCPEPQNKTVILPLTPEPTDTQCWQPDGIIGLHGNGVSLYGWTDISSYADSTWYNVAQKFEPYDIDINEGHAGAGGDYHFHAASGVLTDAYNDTGDSASTIFGFASDGYPIVGPYVSAGVIAQSCWKPRNYEDPTLGGCGTERRRTCLLVDQFNVSSGVIELDDDLEGPTIYGSVLSMSGNEISTASGAYFEDYYYDPECTEQGDEYLDQYNIRYSEELGSLVYTVTTDFSYNIGQGIRGTLQDNGPTACQTGYQPPSGRRNWRRGGRNRNSCRLLGLSRRNVETQSRRRSAPFLAGRDTLTDIIGVSVDGDYISVNTNGIPKQTTTITEAIYETLLNRPLLSSDFDNGTPAFSVGDEVEWGGDVGYNGTIGCSSLGYGYWPNGPDCPEPQNKTVILPLTPEPTDTQCWQPDGIIGLYGNGVSLYGWTDTSSYADSTWYNVAQVFGPFDIDINEGHAGEVVTTTSTPHPACSPTRAMILVTLGKYNFWIFLRRVPDCWTVRLGRGHCAELLEASRLRKHYTGRLWHSGSPHVLARRSVQCIRGYH